MNRSDYFRSIVAQGWAAMFVVFVANITVELMKNAVEGGETQAQWLNHISLDGIKFILVILSIYAIVPILIRTLSAIWFRWTVVGLTVAMSLFVAAHEISHLMSSTKPWGLLHALDVTHHILAVWVIVSAVLWARQPVE